MQARIITSPDQIRYLELCLHHNNFPEWEWRIMPRDNEATPTDQIVSLAGPVADWSTAPDALRTLGPEWTTLTTVDREWIRANLFTPLINSLKTQLDRVRDFATLCGSMATFYEAIKSTLEQAERDYLFTSPTPRRISARWRLNHSDYAHPTNVTPLELAGGVLQIFTENGTTLLMQCMVERWRDGLYWIANLEEDSLGAFIPGLMLAYLDCLPFSFLCQDEDPLAHRPESLHPDLQAWLIATMLWPDEIHPDPDHVIEHLREKAAELSPTSIGRTGHQYSKRLAVERVIKDRPVEDILNDFFLLD